ncbi:dihydroneopterin aldolase [Sulfurospirillum arcachonense]|uniref:dihydroneopterin aldolase n=1 Tax=Sulfurospirillum arcachonense TaxID=57666 RepID=UPI00046A1DD7|nr:dihydroneopterin aldolase [Sulfurospirillum arcachonense]
MKIYIENLTFKAIIGILEEERKTPQKVIINCEINYTYKKNKFINYAEVSTCIENSMKKNKFLLIEDALLKLNEEIKSKFPLISSMKLKISKPKILDNTVVSVELEKIY